MEKKIIIVGAGLVGSLLACYMSRRGNKVKVYERRPDMRVAGYEGGRSINLALSHRGIKALSKIGMYEKVRHITIPMYGRMIHDEKGKTQLIPYGKESQAIYSISRGELNRIMIEEADTFENVDFSFNQRCVHIEFETGTVQFEDVQTKKITTEQADIVFGSDGAYSQVRYQMQITPNFNIHQHHETYGYKELHISPGPGGQHQIEKNALHIWPRGGFMLIALPNTDGSFTVTLFNNLEGENSFASLSDEKSVNAFFQKFFPDAQALMPDLCETFFRNPTSSLVTIRCYPWKYKNTCLIGDAAHAIVPFYGQGMNCGFEDVNELDEILNANGEDWEKALQQFQVKRKPNADAILDLALHNYIEMRDLSGRPEFQLRTQIEKRIADAFPQKFMTHYSMVTFSDLSYQEAKIRGEKQNQLLDQIMEIKDIEKQWQSEEILQKAEKWLSVNT